MKEAADRNGILHSMSLVAAVWFLVLAPEARCCAQHLQVCFRFVASSTTPVVTKATIVYNNASVNTAEVGHIISCANQIQVTCCTECNPMCRQNLLTLVTTISVTCCKHDPMYLQQANCMRLVANLMHKSSKISILKLAIHAPRTAAVARLRPRPSPGP